jgi:Cysteine rich repeat
MTLLSRLVGPILLFSVLLCPATGAVAQQPTQAQAAAIKQSCRADFQSNCSGVPTGGSAALQCLQQHQSNLSSACQSAVAAVSGGGASHPLSAAAPTAAPPAPALSRRQEITLVRSACGGDFHAYCRGVGFGGGRAIGCLAENESRLSPPCKGALAEARGGQ